MVSEESLREFLLSNYEYFEGQLLRKHDYKQWKKGHSVGTVGDRGYVTLYLFSKRYYLHQLIFLMFNGYIPDLIDHDDTDKTNNRIENLIDSNKIKNALNIKGHHRDNRTGFLGVVQKSKNKFAARFRNKYIGTYDSPELAHEAYLDFRRNEGAPFGQAS